MLEVFPQLVGPDEVNNNQIKTLFQNNPCHTMLGKKEREHQHTPNIKDWKTRIWHLTPHFRPSTGWDSYRFSTQGSGQSCNKYDIIPTHFLRMAEMTPNVTPMDTGHSKECYSCSAHIVLSWSWKILLLKNWNIADSVSLQLGPDIRFILRVKLLPVKCL